MTLKRNSKPLDFRDFIRNYDFKIFEVTFGHHFENIVKNIFSVILIKKVSAPVHMAQINKLQIASDVLKILEQRCAIWRPQYTQN